jgi:hypothetical protein
MKKIFIAVTASAIIAFTVYSLVVIYRTFMISREQKIAVLIAYNPSLSNKYPHILKADKSVLEEEGVPYEEVSAYILPSLQTDQIIRTKPVIIFPDSIAQTLPENLRVWVQEYLKKGGHVAVVYDAGIRAAKGYYLHEAIFSRITGVNYITYDKFSDETYTLGYIKVGGKESLDFFQVPSGKIDEGLLLGGYAYGKLEYPVTRNELLDAIPKDEIYASAITQSGEQFPALVMRDVGLGKVLNVNLPLGHLKAHSDDLPLRSIIRTFLFKVVKIPHLMNTYDGKGGLVINWHIDASLDWKSILMMLEKQYLKESLQYSMHITAGNFRDEPGDGLGFDACGGGKPYVKMILPYGSIGSHGGWAHNWFANNIAEKKFGEREIYEQIRRNNECLASVTGYDVKEYAAPNGIHPQPVTTKVLEKLNIGAYYYTGDTGSAPNRTFIDGKMISDTVIAFPIMPFGKSASLSEMKRSQKTEEEVTNWLFQTVDFVVKNRTVRLVYSHPYDIYQYPAGLKLFLDYAEELQNEGRLAVQPMSFFAEFLFRFLKTDASFEVQKNRMVIHLKNPEGLDGITIAVPKHICKTPTADLIAQDDEDYYYLTVAGNDSEKVLSCDIINAYSFGR